MTRNSDTITLDDKWDMQGRVVLSGNQAIARVFLAQREIDERRGWKTAGFVSGYRGSPLGNLDATLWSIGTRLTAAGVHFAPGVNEELAATAVHGTQQIDTVPDPRVEGVFAAWYGKGPGVDRAGDALKHGNLAGAQARGGVLVFYGDDHAAKSSTVAHHSEPALAASLIPSLYPSNVQELFDYGLLGIAMSRYSGSWVGVKCVNEVAEQSATVTVDLDGPAPVEPERPTDTPPDIHPVAGRYAPMREEQVAVEYRLPLVHRFVRANAIDQVRIRAEVPALGIVAAGKSYGDVRAALELLGLGSDAAVARGISVYKVGCIWPLEPEGIRAFAANQRTLFVVEEKQDFLEQQVAAAIVNEPRRPILVGKKDAAGKQLLPPVMPLTARTIALAVAELLEALGLLDPLIAGRRDLLRAQQPATLPDVLRMPFFCSGCPHSRSTRVPDGSVSMTGIGCHTMVTLVRPKTALPPVQMGGEGANWIGISPFTGTRHIFQNLGDGTYYHSGLLAIRAAVAARVNITYKILYNDAVAMTGGQPVDGPISVADIARQVLAEGVVRVVALSDDPDRLRRHGGLPEGIAIGDRDTLDAVQRQLRDVPGCTVLIYEQTCAAEKRRRRKRGTMADPATRLFISKEVCEGCGDCSVQSTCVSLVPVETGLGRKRAIDQSSCNKDMSCIEGFCPSFLTLKGAEPRKPERAAINDTLLDAVPEPAIAATGERAYNIMVAGIGGTGIVTVGALIGMAAHLDGLSMSTFDMTGLSQKNGAVYSHVRVAHTADAISTQRIGETEADLLLAFDLVAATSPEANSTLAEGRTATVANANVPSTAAFQFNRDFATSGAKLLGDLQTRTGAEAFALDAAGIASGALGDAIGANLLLLGVAAQRGLLPVSVAAIERAVLLNGVAVAFNLAAFRLGRLAAVDPARVEAMGRRNNAERPALPTTLDEIVATWSRHLTAYQDEALAARYRSVVERVTSQERKAVADDALARTAARTLGQVLAYKDEYEVARLLTRPELMAEVKRNFTGARIALNLAPPILGGKAPSGRPRKREFGPWLFPILRVLARLRFLRGTAFDPFGRTAERRAERRLAAEYVALVDDVAGRLTSANHAAAVKLLAAAREVRGYGPVKDEALAAYKRILPELRAGFDAARDQAGTAPGDAPTMLVDA